MSLSAALQVLAFSPRFLLLFSAVSSAIILGGALIGQYGFGWYPCELCLLQRWPYVAVILIGLAGWTLVRSDKLRYLLVVLCLLLFLTTFGIAFYHAGVEWGIFTGPSGCSSGSGEAATLEELRAQILAAPLVSCDQAMAHVLGLSLAAWNAIASGFLSILLIACFVKTARFQGLKR